MLSPKVWVTVNEAAEILGVTDSRVRQLLISGDLQGQKFGHSWAISRTELDRFTKIERPVGNPEFLSRKSKPDRKEPRRRHG